MNSRHRYLTLAIAILLSGYGAAQAQGVSAGSYNLTVGKSAPCALTLADKGKATLVGSCARSDEITNWQATPGGLELTDGAGAIYASLAAKGDGYAGVSFDAGHHVLVTPASKTAGLPQSAN